MQAVTVKAKVSERKNIITTDLGLHHPDVDRHGDHVPDHQLGQGLPEVAGESCEM